MPTNQNNTQRASDGTISSRLVRPGDHLSYRRGTRRTNPRISFKKWMMMNDTMPECIEITKDHTTTDVTTASWKCEMSQLKFCIILFMSEYPSKCIVEVAFLKTTYWNTVIMATRSRQIAQSTWKALDQLKIIESILSVFINTPAHSAHAIFRNRIQDSEQHRDNTKSAINRPQGPHRNMQKLPRLSSGREDLRKSAPHAVGCCKRRCLRYYSVCFWEL